jgi:hypothetical protein
MTGLIKFVTKWTFTLLFYAVVFALLFRGFTLLKAFGHDQKWWNAPPCLDAWDPTERIDAAEAAAREYGGKP